MATVFPPLPPASAYAARMSAGVSAPAGGVVAIGGTLPPGVTRSLRIAEHAADPGLASVQTRTLWCAVPWGDGAALAEGASASEEKARAAAAATAARVGRRMGGRCHLQRKRESGQRGVALKIR